MFQCRLKSVMENIPPAQIASRSWMIDLDTVRSLCENVNSRSFIHPDGGRWRIQSSPVPVGDGRWWASGTFGIIRFILATNFERCSV